MENDINMELNQEEDGNEGIPFVPQKGFYQPSTDESWEAYQALISVVENQLGGFPRHVICGAADEVLSVLKSEILFGYRAKKFEMEKLLGPITNDTLEQFHEIGNLINDYNNQNQDEGLLIYQPRSEETWRTFNLFLDVISQIVGDQPEMVLRLGADGVLSILKNDEIEKAEWKKEAIETLHLGPISNHTFDHLAFLGTLITDHPSQPQPNDLPSSSRSTGVNFFVEPTSHFIKEEEMKKDDNDKSPMKFWMDNDDDEMAGPESDLTVKENAYDDDEVEEMMGPESYDDDDDDEGAMTDETGSGGFEFEKVDGEVKEQVKKSDVEDEDWVVVAFDSWKGFKDDDIDMG